MVGASRKASNKCAKVICDDQDLDDEDNDLSAAESNEKNIKVHRPVQQKLRMELEQYDRDLDLLRAKEEPSEEDLNRIEELQMSRYAAAKRLSDMERKMQNMQAHRQRKRNKTKRKIGRPTLESKNIRIAEAISDYFEFRAAENPDIRDNPMAGTSLNELQKVLEEKYDLKIKRSTLYTRLLPRNSTTAEGKRHHSCAPIRLLNQKNDRTSHMDGDFCSATIKYMMDIAEIMGEFCCFFMAQGDKAQVHKLIPSVYTAYDIPSSKATQSGPTYVALRANKSDHSTAVSHLADFNRLIDREEFGSTVKTSSGEIKPILLAIVDGGPEENPRYPKSLASWASVFRERNLDFLMVACHAPGQASKNPVERRMASLSKALSRFILPYEMSEKTDDEEIKLRSAEHTGNALSDIWSKTVIDDFKVFAEFIPPTSVKPFLEELSETWKSNHVLQAQYSLQISRCGDTTCCMPARTNFRRIFTGGFIPPPIPIIRTEQGPSIESSTKDGLFCSLLMRMSLSSLETNHIAFDRYCPSVSAQVVSRTCSACNHYFPTKKALNEHKISKICALPRTNNHYSHLKTSYNAKNTKMNAIVPVMDLNDLLEDNNTGNNVVTNNFSNCLGTDNGGWPIVNETVSSGSHHLTTSSNYVNWSMGQFSPRAWQ